MTLKELKDKIDKAFSICMEGKTLQENDQLDKAREKFEESKKIYESVLCVIPKTKTFAKINKYLNGIIGECNKSIDLCNIENKELSDFQK